MPWYLYLALKQLFGTRQRLFFTAVSVLSVAMGVWILLVVLSVMGGFSEKIGELAIDTQGDITIQSNSVIADPAPLQAAAAKVPGVIASTPFAQGFLLVLRDNKPAQAIAQGVDLDTVSQVMPLRKYIIAGSLDGLDDDSVILGSGLAASIGATIGTKIQLLSPAILEQYVGSRGSTIPIPPDLTVAGIFFIDHQQVDKSTLIVSLRRMQELYDLGSSVHGINLKIKPGLEVEAETRRVNQALATAERTGQLPPISGLWARSWRAQNEDFLWAVQLEKNMMTLILLIVVVVAAFLTMSLLLVLVLKKTREIGLLGALGATRGQVALCFCLQGVGIGILGTAVGTTLGFLALAYRNSVVGFVLHFTGSEEALASVYQFSQLPSHTSGSDLVTIVISAIVLSTMAGAIPAFIAARMNAVEALRNE